MKLKLNKIPHHVSKFHRDEDNNVSGVTVELQIIGIVTPKEIPVTYKFQSIWFKLTSYRIEIQSQGNITFLSATYLK